MSESEEEGVCYFGTPLEPYDEDAFPKKRPIPLEEQVARDAQGRRRFHGAFTGGFSAGFFNTVGSVQGWTPADFRSSRDEKAASRAQKPEDFMDDEDVGQFGIAPQAVRATDDYAAGRKRKKQIVSEGPIPGEPVLETLLQAGNETVGYFLMRNMNRKNRSVESQTGPKVYGCMMPKDLPEDEVYKVPQYNLDEIYRRYLSAPKSNTFGLGYVGLDKKHIDLFQPSKLTVRERNNKKLSISGQAFGVGAFEDEDEDIYVKEDMSKYDFELSAEVSNKREARRTECDVLDIFVLSKSTLLPQNEFPPPMIPASFTGKHNVKKSRFEPVAEETKLPERQTMNAAVRAKYLGEASNINQTCTPSKQRQKNGDEVRNGETLLNVGAKDEPSTSKGLLFDRFVTAKLEDDLTNILEVVKPMEVTHGTKKMHDAVKLKMFGPLTRTTETWTPSSLLCKRFNVPEPNVDVDLQKNKKRTKNLIFEYQKHAENDGALQRPGLSMQTDPAAATNKKEEKEEASKADVAPAGSVDAQPEAQPKETETKIVDITDRVNVSKNIDLFKAVFLSSSESESENEAGEEESRNEAATASVLLEPLVPKIKCAKQGILSNIDFSKINSGVKRESAEASATEAQRDDKCDERANEIVDSDTYGPRLPTSIKAAALSMVASEVYSDDEWVEKGIALKQKKHKKHKKKHKHKSKG